MEPQAIQPEAPAKGKGKGQVIAGRKTDLWKKPRGTGRQEIKEDSEVSKARQEKKRTQKCQRQNKSQAETQHKRTSRSLGQTKENQDKSGESSTEAYQQQADHCSHVHENSK